MRERERERERERGREGDREGAIHVLLIHYHSIFVVAFIISFFFFTLHTVFLFWIRYKISVISSNAY